MSDGIIVLTTWPDQAGAEKLAEMLVSNKLAACVNILPRITSVYRWRGKLEQGQEHQLVIKSQKHLYSRLEQSILEQHPYELPELLVLPVQGGSTDYLNWITDTLDD